METLSPENSLKYMKEKITILYKKKNKMKYIIQDYLLIKISILYDTFTVQEIH